MKGIMQPGLVWKIMRWMNTRMVQNYQKGFGPQRMVLLLTTIGRKSGLPRITPLQYEKIDDVYYVASARGEHADWYKNLQHNTAVHVQVGRYESDGIAELVTDPARIANFLELRLKMHPFFIGVLLRLEGLPIHWKRIDMERIASTKVLAILHLVPAQESINVKQIRLPA
jgi:deazaflavin-dependent oxidoreductase (nitroreductase family)